LFCKLVKLSRAQEKTDHKGFVPAYAKQIIN
jgi:hypothetical protein